MPVLVVYSVMFDMAVFCVGGMRYGYRKDVREEGYAVLTVVHIAGIAKALEMEPADLLERLLRCPEYLNLVDSEGAA